MDTDESREDQDDGDGRDVEDDEDLIADAKARFAVAQDVWDENRRNALDDIRFARLSEQWPEQIRRDREQDGRPCLTINGLPTFIRQVVNDARQNKPAITVHPVGGGSDPETAEIFNGLIRHIEQSSDADVAYDTALDNSVTASFGYFRINTRYTCDDTFEQDLAIERINDPLSVYGDPNDLGADSADWNEAWIIDTMAKSAFEKRWPGKEAVSFDADVISKRESEEEQVQVAEHWTREEVKRPITVMSAPDPEQMIAMPSAAEQALRMVSAQMIVDVEVYQANKALFDALQMKPVGQTRDVMSYKVTQRILSGAEVLEKVDWAGKYIPIVPVWGEEVIVEGVRHLRSLIRDAKDPQRMLNYWRTTSTELVALAPKTPFIGPKGSFETDAAKWATANTQTHAYIEYDPQPGGAAPQRQPYASIPAGALNEANTAREDIMSIIGIYKASLGAASNEDSGVAINARDKQADTGTFHYIDNLNRALRHAGRILLDLIPKVYSTPRVIRILGVDGKAQNVQVNQPTQVQATGPDGQPAQDPETGEMKAISKVYDLTVGSYDVTVSAGPAYATQRQEAASQMMDLLQHFPQAAPVIGDLIAKNLDWPGADEIAERLKMLLPAALRGEDPVIAQGKQLIQKLEQENAALKADQSYDHGKLEIDAYKAETDRIQTLSPQGMPTTPEEMQAVVMQVIRSVLVNPDALLDGMASVGVTDPLAGAGGAGGLPPSPPAAAAAPDMPPQF